MKCRAIHSPGPVQGKSLRDLPFIDAGTCHDPVPAGKRGEGKLAKSSKGSGRAGQNGRVSSGRAVSPAPLPFSTRQARATDSHRPG
jgi:hypothetical protein